MAEVTSSRLHPVPHTLHLAEIEPRPAIFRSWERARQRRAQWLIECIAEMVTLPRLPRCSSVLTVHSLVFSAIAMQAWAPLLHILSVTS
jgi:hypothetical protein